MLPGKNINKHNEKIDEIVNRRNGKVIEYYINSDTKLKIICSEGHEFNIAPHKLYDGKWCLKCVQSISEEFTRFIFEKIFNEKFEKIKFHYNGHCLELDGYNSDINIAFEYNGIQHYRKNEFIRTDEQLEYQKYLDNLKIDYCKENNIKFVVIPFTVKHYDIYEFVKNELNLNIDITIDYNQFSDNYSYTRNRKEELNKFAAEKEGKVLEFGSNFVKLECKRGHTWNLLNYLLKGGTWCKKCFDIEAGLKYDKILERCSKMNIELLTTKGNFNFNKGNIILKCNNNHLMEMTKDKFNEKYQATKHGEKEGRRFCQDCLLDRQNKYLDMFGNVGIIPVNEYIDRKTEIVWQFPCNHQSLDKAKNINERVKRNHYLCKECCKK